MWATRLSTVEERAVEEFGLTDDPREAGYILSDGSMLDLSGRIHGGYGGTRARDHREIAVIYPQMRGDDRNRAMYRFMAKEHAIRFGMYRSRESGWSFSLDVIRPPTREQQETLRALAPFVSEFFVDVGAVSGRRRESGEFADIEEAIDFMRDNAQASR